MPLRPVTDPALLQQLSAGSQPTNPMFPGQMQGQGLNNAGQALQNSERAATLPYAAPKAAADATRSQIGAQVDAATAPADIAQKGAAARKSAVDATTAERSLAATGGADTTETKNASFYTRAIRANQMYSGTGINDEPMSHAFAKDWLPEGLVNKYTSHARQVAESAQRDFISSTLRYESGAAISPAEFANQQKIYFPVAGDSPENIAAKEQLRQNAIEGLKVSAGPAAPILDAQHPQAPQGAPNYSQMTGPPSVGLSHGATRSEFDPQTSAAMDRLIKLGRPVSEVAAYAQGRGFQVTPEVLSTINEARKYLSQHPGFKGSFVEATKSVPNETVGQMTGGSAFGGLGSAMGNAATAGFNDEIAGGFNALGGGSYTQGRDAYNARKELVADAHPYADLAGTALGSATTMGTLGAAGKAAGLGQKLAPALRYGQTAEQAAGIGASRLATLGDLGYGTTYGAGTNNDNRALGAGEGLLASGAGNLAGRGVTKTLGGLVSPSGGKLAPLYAMGVRPSIGQRAGGLVNNFEEKFQSIPFLGDAIQGTRQRARDQFQVGLFNDALGEIGQTLPKGMGPGHAPHKFAQEAFGKAYDSAERGMTAVADPAFGTDLGNLQKTVSALPEASQGQFSTIWDASVGRRFKLGSGSLSGDAYKDAMSELSKKVAAIRKNPQGDHELAGALEEAMASLRGSATRNSPPEAVAALDAADKGYAKLVRIEAASRKAGGDAATFNPNQYNAAVKETAGGIRSRGYLSGEALNSDIAAKGLHLQDQVSNSGSFDRYAPAAAMMGGAFLEPKAALALGGLGLLNAPGVRNVTTALMAPRNNLNLRTLADLIRAQQMAAGTIGSAGAIGLLPSQ